MPAVAEPSLIRRVTDAPASVGIVFPEESKTPFVLPVMTSRRALRLTAK